MVIEAVDIENLQGVQKKVHEMREKLEKGTREARAKVCAMAPKYHKPD
jgi:hypothetical protein